ncbi:MAG: YebC/PmpR family DNA-binding transcriptional regulator [Candidatus Shapirobacteria bacterium]|jgi:YebC/PmpR family DNA-binding regulatory protein
MSGHSKWANIKNRKGAQDKKRSEAFTKKAKDILTAVRVGGGNTNPETNHHLKMAIDKAREVNMPKEKISGLLEAFEQRKAHLANYVFEGYGPLGVPIIVEAESDNKNRTIAEVRSIFKNHQGNLGEEGSVRFLFDRRGEVELEKGYPEKELEVIDAGAVDIEDNLIWVMPEEVNKFSQKMEAMGLAVKRAEVVMKAKSPVWLKNEDEVASVLDLIESLEDLDEVTNVYSGMDFKADA